jgi:chromosome partitioning protein
VKNKIVLVGSEKGGVGKTTISFNLAVLRAIAGYPVLLVDADKQASSSMLASMRTDGDFSPPLICVQKTGKMGADLLELRTNYEIIIDAGGVDSVELRQSIAVADIWVLPASPSQLDLFAMAKMARLQAEVEERVGRIPRTVVVLNPVAPNTREWEEAREMLSDNEKMPVLNSQLTNRVAHRRAIRAGCGVIELTGKSHDVLAVAEMIALYEEIYGEEYAPQH